MAGLIWIGVPDGECRSKLNQETTVLEIAMSDEKVLTKEMACVYLFDHSVHLYKFNYIDDDAAEVLRQDDGRGLDLDGLISLSEAAAESLAQHRGYLDLGGLETLSDTAAAKLGSIFQGEYLNLCNLHDLSDAAYESICTCRSDLTLSSKSLTVAAAKNLCRHKHEEREVYLYFKTLSDSVAEGLSGFVGQLSLASLESLSDAAAESLSKTKGTLLFEELRELSDAAAESLAKHEGQLDIPLLCNLPESAATILRKHPSFADASVDVILVSCGDRKLDVVKQVKTLTGTSLREAKQMVESCPTPLKEAVSEEDAEKIKIEIERAAGRVAIKNDV